MLHGERRSEGQIRQVRGCLAAEGEIADEAVAIYEYLAAMRLANCVECALSVRRLILRRARMTLSDGIIISIKLGL